MIDPLIKKISPSAMVC
jgi:NAD(P)-dependent dehydrogenase (short-subunit alcohol dehydrogenase family)